MALIHTPEKIEFGANLPDFTLLATNGKNYQKKDFLNGKPLVVMFICNHCPYVKAIEDRLIELAYDFNKHNINVVAICSNDAVSYTEDSFENLKKRAEEKNYPFVYLHDKNQTTAKLFGAVCTPDFFVYDNSTKLAYRGRLDDSWKNSQTVTDRELFNATLQLLHNQKITKIQTPSMGCSIKWIKNA